MKISKKRFVFFILILFFIVLIGAFGLTHTSAETQLSIHSPATTNLKSSSILITNGICQDNKLTKELIVIISEQHLWACQYSKLVFNTPVVTGYERFVADTTPTGTYKIYNKQTNINLTGSDEMGSWNVHVDYWMAFLSNQYGIFGLHDASWVPDNDFGLIKPNSLKASHGCVELPLSSVAWIYNWAPVGTTLVIKAN